MIRSLTLSRFKCFLNLRIPQLARITLLGGENSIGKTSLLEAIFLFYGRYAEDILVRLHGWRGMPVIGLAPEELFAPFFFDYCMDRDILLSFGIDNRTERLRMFFVPQHRKDTLGGRSGERRPRKAFVRTDVRAVAPNALALEYQGSRGASETAYILVGSKGLEVEGAPASGESRTAVFLQSRSPIAATEDAQRFGRLDKMGLAGEIVEFLKRFYPHLEDLSLIPGPDGKPVIHADIGLARKVPAGYVGDGFCRLLSVYLAIASAPKGVVLIDEIGGGIHYSALAKVWRGVEAASEKYGCQVVATTHSYECIQAARQGLEELLKPDFLYIRLDKSETGVVPKLYSFDVLGAAVESGWEVR